MQQNTREEAKQYFGRKVFKRLFSLFKDKIESLDNVGGSVKFIPTPEERSAIETWFGKPMTSSPISVSLAKFEKRMAGSRFEGLTLKEVVELVTDSPIVPKKTKIMLEKEKKNRYFQTLEETYTHPYTKIVIRKILNKEKGTAGFVSSYNAGDFITVENILKAVSNLPEKGKFERLPVFAQRITGNPHYFDKSKKLYHALELIFSETENRSYRSNLTAEEESHLLSMVGLAKDDLHSFVTCYGLDAYQEGNKLQQWHWANMEKNIQNIPLRSLQNIDKVKPNKGNKVFILENSGVYSNILDELDDVYPIVCTHGNFKLSGMLLLDKLVNSGVELYYSGDIDVTGLFLARYIKSKYREKIHFWRMGVEDYHLCSSEVQLSNAELKRLEGIEDKEFEEVIKEMNVIKKAGYQEPLLMKYVSDIKNLSFAP